MLSVVAISRVKEGFTEQVKAEMIKLLAPTRQEAGCINYDLHQDQDDPNHFVFYENWESLAHLIDHSKSAHIQAFRNAVKGMMESSSVHKMSQVNP